MTIQADYPRLRMLASGKVQQAEPGGLTELDPHDWHEYAHGEVRVRACRMPGPFVVNGELCGDGWLVKDLHGLKAVGNRSFSRYYRLVPSLGLV